MDNENLDNENPYQENPYQENPHQENPNHENEDQENLDNDNPYQVNPHQENPDQENPYQENPYKENPYKENPYQENPYQENPHQENLHQENLDQENPYQKNQDQENPYQEYPHLENPYHENEDQENLDNENPLQENPYQEYPHQENPHQENQDQENPYQEYPYQENPHQENPNHKNEDQGNLDNENPYQVNPHQENPDQENPYQENPYQENPHQENPYQKNQYQENPYQEYPHLQNPYHENEDQENLDNENPYQVNPHQENLDQENPHQENQDQENPYQDYPRQENPHQENEDQENLDNENPYQVNPHQENPDQENPDQENPYQEYPHHENPHQENPYHNNQDHENQDQKKMDHENPYQDQCPGGSCNPQLGDLMVGREAQLSSSSTCGSDGPQKYCIIGYLQGEQKCFTCDSRLPYHRHSNPNSHRIQNIITTFDPDSKMKWWQSENGVHGVSIRLDLETMFQFSHLILTFRSFRPAAMLVERSRDFGRSWKVLRYFSEDCSLHFPSVSTDAAESVDDIVCDSRYSGPEPSTNGEVVLKALDPVFEIENPYAPNVQDLTLLTNLRVNFTRLFTLGDTLLSRRRRNPQNKYFYSLYNMVVQGRCFCHGHAQHCSPVGGRGDVFTQPGMVHGHCVCQHNTAGENCEQCQHFHHDSPWRPGGERPESICRRCFCHGHSDSCHFDAERYQLTNGQSGGVCDECRNRRSGPQCERCAPFFFQDPQRTPEDPLSCIPCDCNLSGSLGAAQCDAQTGRCICKENVEGLRCDRCKHGFYGLREDDPAGCQACRCHTLGSVGCDQQTGACQCERLAVGAFCDRCVEGFWGLGSSGQRCSVCDCDIGGAQCNTCAHEDGQCPCLPNMIGRRCSDPAHGYFLPSLGYFLYEAELAAPLPGSSPIPIPTTPPPSSSLLNPGLLPRCEQYYREQGFDFKVSNGRVVLVRRTRRRTRQKRQRQERSSLPLFPGLALQMIPRQRSADQPATWTGLGLVRVMEGAGLRFTVDNLPSSSDYQLVIAYELEAPSNWLASVSIVMLSPGNRGCPNQPEGTKTVLLPGKSRLGILDAPVCLNAGAQYFVDVALSSQSGSENSHILIDSIGLILSFESVPDLCTQDDVAVSHPFRCVGLAVSDSQESLLEVCEGIIKSLSAKIHKGAVACKCNLIGSLSPSCSKVGGVCECKTNVIGHCCDRCAPLTFGFGPDGCTGCACDPYGSLMESCDPISGQCACRPEVSEQRCDSCQRGLWGFPSCQRCECNGHSEDCDQETGQCVNCRGHTSGNHCERCEEGYHGYPLCRPCLCPELLGSSRFFATSCQYDSQSLSLTCNCLEGHTGPRCDLCSPGYYGNLTLDGARCQECPCNNNVDPSDSSACDTVTGECLRCRHNTAGPRCQSCKPGYYGNAVQQACRECTCDRRGTQVTACPLDSRCFCNAQTGRCPCRTGATGDQCDQCEDGYWNLDGVSGCQPCSCDPTNAVSNVCDKVSGQCLCRPEFGGRQCDECGENHFGNPDLQCVSCDCNLEGTLRPACNPETGECLCRPGVSGILCEECAPGRDSAFPDCKECHPCRDLWSGHVIDILRAAERMSTLIPGTATKPAQHRQQQLMLRIHSELEKFHNISNLSMPGMERVDKLFLKVRKLKDVIDPNIIIIDPSSLLNTDMENIQQEFTKLLNRLKDNILTLSEDTDSEGGQELFEEIQKLHRTFMSQEQRLKDANRAVEVSMATRQDAKDKLNTCSSPRGDLTPLEKKVQQLQILPLNKKICGDPGLEDCSGCGGALCTLSTGRRKCGGPNCGGVLPLSVNISETAKRVKEQLQKLPTRLLEYKNKVDKAKEVTKDAITQTNQLQKRLSNHADDSERKKNQTKELIQRVREYLMDDLVPPEDISRMAAAVLKLKLPRSREQISSMIEEIKKLLNNAARSQDDLKNLSERAKSSQDLLKQALSLRDRTKDVDIKDISRNLYEAEHAQDKANDALEASSNDRDTAKDLITNVEDRLTDIEDKLTKRPGDLLNEIRVVKLKVEDNRQTATDAKESAQTALDTATDTQGELAAVVREFEDLKQKRQIQTGQSEAEKRLNDMVKEAEDVKKKVEERLRRIQDLEQRMELLEEQKQQRAADVLKLLEEAEFLRQAISSQAEAYASCST
ncbi:laminin subunit beta-4 isoform X2 [Gouania willdenowi]|nr:laminin subunit beta-4-like isoform X2 [Gouania willdenowi]